MSNRLPETASELESATVQSMLQRYRSEGQLPLDDSLGNFKETRQWTLEAMADIFRRGAKRAPSATGPGAVGPAAEIEGAWRENAKDRMRRKEGFRAEVYPDLNKGDAAPTIGYGFNLAPKTLGRAALKQALDLDDRAVDEFANGKRRMTRDQAEKVLDIAVEMAGAQVDKEIGDTPIHAKAKAALVDVVYNSGIGSVKSRGIFDAVRKGDMNSAVKSLLDWKDKQPGVNTRRRFAAMDLVAGDFHKYSNLFD